MSGYWHRWIGPDGEPQDHSAGASTEPDYAAQPVLRLVTPEDATEDPIAAPGPSYAATEAEELDRGDLGALLTLLRHLVTKGNSRQEKP